MGLGSLFSFGNTGAHARRLLAESETADRNEKAQSTFYDTSDSDAFKDDLNKRIADIAGRKAPTVTAPTFGADAYAKGATVGPVALASGTTIDRSGDLAARAQQQSALSMLAAQAAGKGPSVAGAQMNQSVDQTLAAQSAAMGSGGRTFGGLGARAAMLAGSGALSGAAAQSAATKAQEANSGAQQFASLAGAMRGADINAAMGQAKLDQETALANAGATNAATMANAGFGQQASLYNAQAALSEAELKQKAELANVEMVLRARGMNDAAIQSYLAAYQKQFQVDKAAKTGYWDFAQANNQFTSSLQDKKEADAAARDAGRMDGLISMGILAASMMSDRDQKDDVKPGDGEIRAFLRAVKPYSYKYKNPELDGAAPGRHVSPMAQDIESTDIGRAAVETGPDGIKRVNYGRLLGSMLAAQSYLNKRLDDVTKERD